MEQQIECPECGALQDPDTDLCVECEAEMEVDAPPPRRPKGPGSRGSRGRREAALPMKKARTALKGVRGLTWFFAGILGMNLPLVILASADGGMMPTVLISAAVTVAFFLGALFLYRAPLQITTGVAVLVTASTILNAVQGAGKFSLAICGGVTILMWGAVARVRSALAALNDAGGSVEDLNNLGAQKDQDSLVKTMIGVPAGIGALILLAIGGFLFMEFNAKRLANRPEPPIGATIEAWVDAFGSGELEKAANLCTDDYRERWPKIEAILEREGWRADGVEVTGGFVTSSKRGARAITFDLPRGKMKTIWRLDDDEWRVDKVTMSKVRKRK